MYKHFIKRTFDIILSAIGIVVAIIPMGIIALAIKMDSPGPVIFRQKRVGINKSFFNIYKFRTMRTDTPHDAPTHLLNQASSYITRVGAFLRKTSLDEIPQFFNIFKGDMSVIGPRPALWNQEGLIAQRDKYGANGDRPGLTRRTQINGRDELPIAVKAKLDGEYCANMSLRFDLKCFFGTIRSVLRHEGVVEGAVAPEQEENEEVRQ